jgi:hypothetical protein
MILSHRNFWEHSRYWICRGDSPRSPACWELEEGRAGAIKVEHVSIYTEHFFEGVCEGRAALVAQQQSPNLARYVYWLGMLVTRLHFRFEGAPGLPPLPSYMGDGRGEGSWMCAAVQDPSPLRYWREDFWEWWDSNNDKPLVLLYDNLEDFFDPRDPRPWDLLRDLLSFWMDVTCRSPGSLVCPKLFFREPVFQGAISGMVDAPKLSSRSATLEVVKPFHG